ncbi:hypothetical protein, partial [Methylicorpusculum sp.]|uniref:hypothetical protein n=1 Tax=Methylicorpusculum sp. TaxID=2713644 RepID=UPI002ABCA722
PPHKRFGRVYKTRPAFFSAIPPGMTVYRKHLCITMNAVVWVEQRETQLLRSPVLGFIAFNPDFAVLCHTMDSRRACCLCPTFP